MFRTCSNGYVFIPVREYRSVEINVSYNPLHTVGMQPVPTDAFRTECKGLPDLSFLPSDTFLRNVMR
jgi:hypothetical protein